MMRVTAAGSLPGDDFRGALTAMTEVLPEVLPLPELPARGVGSAGRWGSLTVSVSIFNPLGGA